MPEVASPEAWLEAVQGADVIGSDGSYLLENLPNLKNVFVTYPYIELGAFNSEELKANGVLVANTRGSNRDSIVEWAMFAILASLRKFVPLVRPTSDLPFERTQSLYGKKVLIVGKGDIGTQVGRLCEAFGMEVDYFVRGGELAAQSAAADVVVNALSVNSSSKNLLDQAFFAGLKPGAYFVSFVRHYTFDIDGIIKVLDSGVLAGAAIDCDPERAFDTHNEFYQKCLSNEKILVTPHIAAVTERSAQNAAEILVQNIEAYLSGNPQNVITKT